MSASSQFARPFKGIFHLLTLLLQAVIIKHVQFLSDCSRKLILVLEKQLKNKWHEIKLCLVTALDITDSTL